MSVFTDEVVVSNTVTVDGSGTTQPISGSVSVSNFPATQPVSGTVNVGNTVPVTGPLTDTQLRATPVPVSASITFPTSSTATITQVVLTANTSTQLLAANPNRLGIIVFVPKSTTYIKYGTTASATSFTYPVMAANTIVEMNAKYTGRIDIIATAGQTVTVTEF